MLDPNLVIQQTLYDKMQAAAVTLNGNPVPVYSYAPLDAAAPFVLVDHISTVPLPGTAACKRWEARFQLTILTSFPNAGQASDLPSLLISGQLLTALDGKQFLLEGGYQMQPLVVAQTQKMSRYEKNALDVLRYISLTITVYQDK